MQKYVTVSVTVCVTSLSKTTGKNYPADCDETW